MGIGHTGCELCGGVHRRRGKPVGVFHCEECAGLVCQKHVEWVDDGWVCKRCVRRKKGR